MFNAAVTSPPSDPSGQWSLMLARVMGTFSALLGSLVIFGWYTHNQALLRISPAFVAMAYNAALGFVFSGLGLLFAGRDASRPARYLTLVSGGICLMLGVLTLSEYLLGFKLGLDELFMKSYVRSGVTAPGRMAFCSALCFTVVGLLLLLGCIRRFPTRPLLTALGGSLVIALGTIALSGYFTGIAQGYVWGAFTRMAVHTATGFLMLGLGVIAYAWNDDRNWQNSAPRWLPLFIGVGASTVTLCLWQALVVEENAQKDVIRRLAMNSHLPLAALSRSESLLPLGELIGGLLLAVLLAGAVTLAQTARLQADALRDAHEALELRVSERTEELAEANQALREVSGWQRGFLRDALASVTDGKLRLCDGPEDLPEPCASYFSHPIFLTRKVGLSDLRCAAQEVSQLCQFSTDRSHDLVTAVNEAGMNAIVHGGGGFARISFSPEGMVQVRVIDEGQGITMENLPRATLKRGFTTAGSLGHGLKMILQSVDRLWLLTGPSGTTVVLEQDRALPLPPWL